MPFFRVPLRRELIRISLTHGCKSGIYNLQADPCSVRVLGVYLKEPIPVLREIRSCRIGNACLPGLPDARNDHPLDSKGSLQSPLSRHRWR